MQGIIPCLVRGIQGRAMWFVLLLEVPFRPLWGIRNTRIGKWGADFIFGIKCFTRSWWVGALVTKSWLSGTRGSRWRYIYWRHWRCRIEGWRSRISLLCVNVMLMDWWRDTHNSLLKIEIMRPKSFLRCIDLFGSFDEFLNSQCRLRRTLRYIPCIEVIFPWLVWNVQSFVCSGNLCSIFCILYSIHSIR